MPSAIPPTLAAYIQACLASHTQSLVTSVLSTPSTWLCLRLVYAALHGVEGQTLDRLEPVSRDCRPVIFVSLLRPLSLWTEMGRKLGLDIPALLRSKKILYIDGLSPGSGPTPATRTSVDGSLPPTLKLKSLDLNDIRDAVNAALKSISTPPAATVSPPVRGPPAGAPSPRTPQSGTSVSTPNPILSANTKPIILLDGIDFVLASEPNVSALALQSVLSIFRSQCHAVVVTGNADAPLLHTATSPESGTPLERDHAHFLTSMAHQSNWVWQLRGLDTGSAKDVTGVLRISRGGDLDSEEQNSGAGAQSHVKFDEVADAEWLYQVKGDGSVKIWSRGE
ncbi:hypothetical protein LTR13_006880 [Exophiala sideris]|uniref:Elongator complex protein 6 n=1 Tax=Exophiala sideris TaxID=1016849 RepID=A0ABR0J3J9_9EURO|nr:hypothetical protein LTR13_006880 [Exophiala sideris]KAK5055650.1 hypothetical protein LTR69_008483 [Exophiala sideris]